MPQDWITRYKEGDKAETTAELLTVLVKVRILNDSHHTLARPLF